MSSKVVSCRICKQETISSESGRRLKKLRFDGFPILGGPLDSDKLKEARERLVVLYQQQELNIGADVLKAIKKPNLVRCPRAEDTLFLSLAHKLQLSTSRPG